MDLRSATVATVLGVSMLVLGAAAASCSDDTANEPNIPTLTCDPPCGANQVCFLNSCTCSVGAIDGEVGDACSSSSECRSRLCDTTTCMCLAAPTPSGCVSLGNQLSVGLSWSGAANLDVGAVTPAGFVAANFEGDPDADPNCGHSGDDLGNDPGAHSETMQCESLAAGDYTIAIDNRAATAIDFTLEVQVDNADINAFTNQTGGSPLTDSIRTGMADASQLRVEFCLD